MKISKPVSVLNALESKGFELVVSAIREKLPFLAEAHLMVLEEDYTAHCKEYSTEEQMAICQAIQECWSRIDLLKDKQPVLKRHPYDGKHLVADGDMPEPNVQLIIDCAESRGGAAALGSDGKWYWTYDLKLDKECKYTVTHWSYL